MLGNAFFLVCNKIPKQSKGDVAYNRKDKSSSEIYNSSICLFKFNNVSPTCKIKSACTFKIKNTQLSIKTGKVTSPRMLVAKIIWRGVFDNRKKWCLGIHSATNDPPFPSSLELGFYTIERAHSYCGAIQPRIICCGTTDPTVGVTPNKIAIKIVIFVYFRTVLLISTNTGQWKMENFHIQNIRISRR